MNRPLYYNLFLITCTCRTCGEEYVHPDIFLAREISKGVAYSPPGPQEQMFDVPVHKKNVQRDVPWCSMCVDLVPRKPLTEFDNKRSLHRVASPEEKAVEIDLEALGLL